MNKKLSIIIPTLNEEMMIGKLISYLREEIAGQKDKQEDHFEIILADGGSTDNTPSCAKYPGVTIVHCQKSQRAHQMNAGARRATGEILYFLHADSFPPRGFINYISHSINRGIEAGCFRLKFDHPHPILRICSWFTRFDINLFRFGDQSLFIKRSRFESIGGYNEQLDVMEDHEIVSRIKQKEIPFTIIIPTVQTSARKYCENGIVRLQLIYVIITLLYHAGARQDTLIHLYRSLLK